MNNYENLFESEIEKLTITFCSENNMPCVTGFEPLSSAVQAKVEALLSVN